MAKVKLYATLGEDKHFFEHISGDMELKSKSKTLVVFEDDNGTELHISGRDLAVDKDGEVKGGIVTSAVFYNDDGEKLISFSNFEISAKLLWNATEKNGWLWSDNGNGFGGTILKGKDFITGTAIGDRLVGWTGNDTIDGKGGDDQIFAWKGDDVVKAGNGNDFVHLGAGNDRGFGGAGHDLIYGYDGKDIIKGEGGIDSIYGGRGKDKLFGGADLDYFVFEKPNESLVSKAGRDVIADFKRGEDIIWLTWMDANITKSGDQNFEWRGTKGFSGDAGELRMQVEGNGKDAQTIVSADLNGDKKADFAFALDGNYKLTASDFAL